MKVPVVAWNSANLLSAWWPAKKTLNAGLLHLSIVAFLPPVPYADISTGNNLKLRPIYNVAHMVNGNSQINEEWVNEANAIEVDLAFTNEGYPDKF